MNAVYTSSPFIVESSNIINIGIIYINFYLVYGYLFNFSVGEVCECVRLCEARGKLRELVSACGLKKKKVMHWDC